MYVVWEITAFFWSCQSQSVLCSQVNGCPLKSPLWRLLALAFQICHLTPSCDWVYARRLRAGLWRRWICVWLPVASQRWRAPSLLKRGGVWPYCPPPAPPSTTISTAPATPPPPFFHHLSTLINGIFLSRGGGWFRGVSFNVAFFPPQWV